MISAASCKVFRVVGPAPVVEIRRFFQPRPFPADQLDRSRRLGDRGTQTFAPRGTATPSYSCAVAERYDSNLWRTPSHGSTAELVHYDCLSEDELFACAKGGNAKGMESLLRHLDRCANCRYLLAEASRTLGAGRIAAVPATPTIANPTSHTLRPGDVLLDRYRIEGFVARGGRGEVYRAQDILLEETIALKTLACTTLEDQRAASRFKAEARLARKVTHLNVCRILEFGIHLVKEGASKGQSIPFLTMEFLTGETMAARIARTGRMPEANAAPFLLQVVAGLRAIHACGIVHRDFKSENVFLVPNGARERAMVMDFGLARPLDGSASSTWPLARMIAGTIDTMAPEQIEGRTPQATMDVYAFGVFAFELLTGRRPFINVPVITRLYELAPQVSSVIGAAGRRWDNLVARCLELEPAARYPNITELSLALHRVVSPLLSAT